MKDKRRDRDTTNKEQILASVRNAIIEKPEAMFKDIDLQSDTWKPIREEDGTAITFVQRFKDMGGVFIYLENEAEFGDCMRQLAPQNDWEPLWCTSPAMQEMLNKYGLKYSVEAPKEQKRKLVTITNCEHLVAQTGSIILTDANTNSRNAYTDADVLLVVARTGQITGNLKEALQHLKEKLGEEKMSQVVILTGMTRTYDFEQEVVSGIQKPRQIAVFLIDD